MDARPGAMYILQAVGPILVWGDWKRGTQRRDPALKVLALAGLVVVRKVEVGSVTLARITPLGIAVLRTEAA